MDNVCFYRTAVHGSHEDASWKDKVYRIHVTSGVRREVEIPAGQNGEGGTANLQNAIAYPERSLAHPFEAIMTVPLEPGTRLVNILSDEVAFCTGPDGAVKSCSIGDTSWRKVTIEFEREETEED
jgi:hypothetical protein